MFKGEAHAKRAFPNDRLRHSDDRRLRVVVVPLAPAGIWRERNGNLNVDRKGRGAEQRKGLKLR